MSCKPDFNFHLVIMKFHQTLCFHDIESSDTGINDCYVKGKLHTWMFEHLLMDGWDPFDLDCVIQSNATQISDTDGLVGM